jgi:hypothetical protein
LVAATRQLDEARQQLSERAVLRERLRIDDELERDLGSTLEEIARRGERANRSIESALAISLADLRALVGATRTALTDARRLAAGYQAHSARAELDSAVALLAAAGVKATVVVAENVDLDTGGATVRGAVQAALVSSLRDVDLSELTIEVKRDSTGGLLVAWIPAPITKHPFPRRIHERHC